MKFAFIAIVGRPSVGKSTLLNKLCGEKVAIVSKVPQTTRNAIRGIVNREEGQLVFIDTPGRHVSQKKFNKKLQEVSDRALEECDIVLYVLDASRPPGIEEDEIITALKPYTNKTVIAINKIDLVSQRHKGTENTKEEKDINKKIIPFASFVSSCLSEGSSFYQISAYKNQGIEELLKALFSLAPEGEPQYGEEFYTDQEVGFRITEIIREQAINRLRQELPHSLYCDIADMELKENENTLWVRAFLIVERESQKGMVVGKGGEMIKAIRLASLKELKKVFDWKIDLDLRVKTGKDWRSKDHVLKKLIV